MRAEEEELMDSRVEVARGEAARARGGPPPPRSGRDDRRSDYDEEGDMPPAAARRMTNALADIMVLYRML